MTYPEHGASYRRTPKWLDQMKKAEGGGGDGLMHNPALSGPDAPPNPVAPPSDKED